MKLIGLIFALLLMAVGCISIVVTVSDALKKHYAVSCVDNNADDYGFTVPQIKAGHRPSPALYERYL